MYVPTLYTVYVCTCMYMQALVYSQNFVLSGGGVAGRLLVRLANLWCTVESTGCLGLLVSLPSTSIAHRHICIPTQNIAAITSLVFSGSQHLHLPELE